MLGKFELKRYTGKKQFSTLDESQLGQLLNQVEVILNQLINQTSDNSKQFTEAQDLLILVNKHFNSLKTVLSYFSEGKGPGIFDWGLLPALFGLYKAKSADDFSTPESILFNLVITNLKSATDSSLKAAKTTKNGEINVASLITSQLKQLTQVCYTELTKHSVSDKARLDLFYADLEQEISNYLKTPKLNLADPNLSTNLINHLKEKLFGRQATNLESKYKESQFKIVHRLTYDFAKLILELTALAPKEFRELAYFFNPRTINEKPVNTGISEASGKDYTYDETNADKSLHYKFKTRAKSKILVEDKNGAVVEEEIVIEETEDMAQKAVEAITNIEKMLNRGIADYYNVYAESQHVKQELKTEEPKAKFIQKFIQHENDLQDECKAKLTKAQEFYIVYPEPEPKAEKLDDFEMVEDSSKPAEKSDQPVIDFSDEKLDEIAQKLNIQKNADPIRYKKEIMDRCLNFMNETWTVYDQLATRKKNYEKTKISVLMSEDLSHEAQDAGFNIDSAFPKVVITKTNEGQYKAFALDEHLAIDPQLTEKATTFDKKLYALSTQVITEISKLHDLDHAQHKKADALRIERLDEQFNYFLAELKIAKHLHSEKPNERIQSIKTNLESVARHKELLATTLATVQRLHNEYAQKVTGAFDDVNDLYKPSRDYAANILNKLGGCEIQLTNIEEALNKELHEAVELSQMMESSNPEDTLKLIEIEKSKLQSSKTSQAQFEQELALKESTAEKYKAPVLQREEPVAQIKEPVIQANEEPVENPLEFEEIHIEPLPLQVPNKEMEAEATLKLEELLSKVSETGRLGKTLNVFTNGKNYFSREQLNNLEGVTETLNWFSEQLEKIGESAKNTTCDEISAFDFTTKSTSNTTHQELKTVLNKTKDIIEADTINFPFEKLDQEHKNLCNFWQSNGFDKFLDDVLKDGYHSAKKWEPLRSLSLTNETLTEGKVSLLKAINKKITDTDNLIRENDIINRYRVDQASLNQLPYYLLNLKTVFLNIKTQKEHILKKEEETQIQKLQKEEDEKRQKLQKIEDEKRQKEQQEAEAKRAEQERLERLELLQKEQDVLLEEIGGLKVSIEKEKQLQLVLSAKIEILENTVELLKQNQELLKMIDGIDQLLLEFSTVELLNTNQEKLYKKMQEAVLKFESLGAPLEALEKKSNEVNIKIRGLLDNSKQKLLKIGSTISTTKAKDMEASLARLKSEIAKYNSKEEPSESDSNWSELNQRLSCLIELSAEIKSISSKLEFMKKDIVFYNLNKPLDQKLTSSSQQLSTASGKTDEHLKQLLSKIDSQLEAELTNLSAENVDKLAILVAYPAKELVTLQSSLEKLDPKPTKLLETLSNLKVEFVNQAKAKFQHYNNQLSKHHRDLANPIDEAKSTLSLNNETLRLAKEDLRVLPTEQLEALGAKLQETSEDLTNLDIVVKQLSTRISDKEKECSALDERIQERARHVANFRSEFDLYCANRPTSYKVKDFFSSDWTERSQYITEVQQALNNYEASGQTKPLFDQLNKRSFPGYNLQPLINRLKLDIKRLPTKDQARIVVQEVDDSLYRRAVNGKPKDFILSINALYREIDSLKQVARARSFSPIHRDIADKLAAELTNTVKQFLIDNKDEFRENNNQKVTELLTAFYKDFDCLLHSQDNVLCQYQSWGTTFKNIAICVLAFITATVNIALSKGGYSNAFYKPDALVAVDEIAKIANAIEYPLDRVDPLVDGDERGGILVPF